MPVLHFLAGPKAAGKFTLYRTLIEPRCPGLPFADTEESRGELLAQGSNFATKTLLLQPSELEVLVQARARGFTTVLYAVCVDAPWLLADRVRQRPAESSNTSMHRIATHYSRSLSLMREGSEFADLALLFDGSDMEHGGPLLVASVTAGRMHLHMALRPRWADKVLGFAEC
jgi:predicted ABC-type ATPase